LWKNWWNEDWQGKPKYSKKTCPSAILSTAKPTLLHPGLNPSRRGAKPATSRLSYGAAFTMMLLQSSDIFATFITHGSLFLDKQIFKKNFGL
jgi:hypothetical protein